MIRYVFWMYWIVFWIYWIYTYLNKIYKNRSVCGTIPRKWGLYVRGAGGGGGTRCEWRHVTTNRMFEERGSMLHGNSNGELLRSTPAPGNIYTDRHFAKQRKRGYPQSIMLVRCLFEVVINNTILSSSLILIQYHIRAQRMDWAVFLGQRQWCYININRPYYRYIFSITHVLAQICFNTSWFVRYIELYMMCAPYRSNPTCVLIRLSGSSVRRILSSKFKEGCHEPSSWTWEI